MPGHLVSEISLYYCTIDRWKLDLSGDESVSPTLSFAVANRTDSKPRITNALTDEMEDCEMEPSEVFSALGMLVVEGRVPELSPKGRAEGPHNPSSLGDSPRHVCDPEQFQCKRWEVMQKQVQLLWRNRIPMCIEVLVLPECHHGRQKATSLDVSLPGIRDSLLLEQWTVQVLPKRSGTSSVSPRVLFQAVKSYLHFSQLSAWLNITHGKNPKHLAYRIIPPGEFCTSTFSKNPEWHTFPMCRTSKSFPIRVTVGSLPRMAGIPRVSCELDCQKTTNPGQNVPGGQKVAARHRHEAIGCANSSDRADSPPCMRTKPDVAADVVEKTTVRKSSPSAYRQERPKSMHASCRQRRSAIPSQQSDRSSQDGDHTEDHVPNKASGAIPKTTMHKSPPPYCDHTWFATDMGSQHANQNLHKNLTSPKVIVTKKSPGQAYYDKDSSARFSPSWLGKDSTDSDNSSPDIDRYLHKTLCSGLEPLSPQEMEAYLASLCPRKPRNPYQSKESFPEQSVYHNQIKSIPPLDLAAVLDMAKTDQTENGSPICDDSSLNHLQQDLQSLSLTSNLLSLKNKDTVLTNEPKPYEFVGKNTEKVENYMKKAHCNQLLEKENKTSSKKTKHSDILPLVTNSLEEKRRTEDNIRRSPNHVINKECKRITNKALTLNNTTENSKKDRCTVSNQKIDKQNITSNSELSNDLDSKNKVGEDYKDMLIEEQTKVPSLVSNNSLGNKQITNSLAKCPDITKHQNDVKFSIGEENGECREDGKSIQNGVCREDGKSLQNGVSNHDYTSPPVSPTMRESIASSPSALECYHANGEMSRTSRVTRRPMHKSISSPGTFRRDQPELSEVYKASTLLKSVMRKELTQHIEGQNGASCASRPIPTEQERATFRENLRNSTNMIFHPITGLPLQSSPAPIKKKTSSCFDYDSSLTNVRAIKYSISCLNLDEQDKTADGECDENSPTRLYSASAPASTNCLLGNFEESVLNGRIEPTGVVEGFTCEIGSSGAFCPKHLTLPVTAFFFSLSDDNAPSPYLGHINLDAIGKRGYHLPKQGTVQVTLFNPNKTVVKMFVVVYDLSDMPPNCQTFLRQRTLYMPVKGSPSDVPEAPLYLRYLIHLRFASSKSGKCYLHTDIRLIFARDKMEYDSRVANYELRSFTEGPTNPKFSPKR